MKNTKKYVLIAIFFIICSNIYAEQKKDFFNAIDKGDTKAMTELIKNGISINEIDEAGWSALHRAVFTNKIEAVRLLLSYKDINIEAVLPEDTELEITGEDSWYADGQTPLHLASFKGYTDIVNLLLNNNADILALDNVDDAMPIHIAAALGNTKTVMALLDSEAAKDSEVNIVEAKDDTDVTPLMWATMKNRIPTMVQLIRYGADLEVKDEDGWTALHFAAAIDSYKAVELLLKAGADANAMDNEENTPYDLSEDQKIDDLLKSAMKN